MAIMKPQTLQYQYPHDPNKWGRDQVIPATPEVMVEYFHKELREHRRVMDALTSDMTHLKGFYGWLMHAYPETIIQYKAIQELQRATEGERLGSSVAMEIPRSQP